MVLMMGLATSSGDLVNIDVEEAAAGRSQFGDPGFLCDLPANGRFEVRVDRLDVPTRLQPPVEPLVEDEQQFGSAPGDDEPGNGEVPRVEVVPGENVRRLLRQYDHLGVVSLLPRLRPVGLEQSEEVKTA